MAKPFDPYAFLYADQQPDEEVEQEEVVSPVEQPDEPFDPYSFLYADQESELPSPEDLLPEPPKPSDNPEIAEKQTYEQMSGDADYMDMLREYQEKRFGEDGKQREEETDEEYLRRFVSDVREFEWNSIDLGQQINWIRSAEEEDRIKFGYLYSELDNLQSFYEEGTTSSYVGAFRDIGKALVTDPLSYIGLGAGKVATIAGTRTITQILKQQGKSAAVKALAKQAGKKRARKIVAGGLAAEAGLLTVEQLKAQELEQLAGLRDEKSFGEAALLGAGATVLFGAPALRGLRVDKMTTDARKGLIRKNKLAKELNSRNKAIKANAKKEAGQRVAEAGKNAPKVFDVDEGRKVLNSLGEIDANADELAQIEFNEQLMSRVGRVVQNVVEDLAESGKLGEVVDTDLRASEVIGQIVKGSLDRVKGKSSREIAEQTERMLVGDDTTKGILDKLDDDFSGDVLQAAISRAGLTNKQFVDAFGASYTNAGKFLQTASGVGKVLKKIKEIDPNLAKEIIPNSEMDKATGMMGGMYDFLKRIDAERRALMVSMPATTVRNILTGGMRLGFDGTANLIEASIYQTAKGVSAAVTGRSTFAEAFNAQDIVREAFGRANRLRDTIGTANLSDDLLAHNPQLASRMDRSLQDLGEERSQELLGVTKWLNGLNMAQDIMFRRAIFTDHIDNKLRRAGVIVDKPTKVGQFKSLEELAASGKQIPADILADGVEEALYFTFSRMPKAGGGKPGDSIGNMFVKITEGLPMVPGIGTGSHPFSRFMVNAMQFQFQYSPLSVVPAIQRTVVGLKAGKAARTAAAMGDEALSAAKMREAKAAYQAANKNLSQGIVGSAALYAAIKYRAENQDTNFWLSKNEDGTKSDLRPLFPLVPYLAIADMIVKAGLTEQATLGTVDQPEVYSSSDMKEIAEAITGIQSRTGTSNFVLENAEEMVKGLVGAPSDQITAQRLNEIMGGYVGSLVGGVTTPARVVRDVLASFDTEAAIVRDAKQTEGLTGGDRFGSAVKNTVMKDLPGLANKLPQIESPTRAGPVFRQGSMEGQTTGVRREMMQNVVEAETERLGIKPFRLAPSTGDKTADALIKGELGGMLEKELDAFIQSDRYQNMSTAKQRTSIKARISFYRSRAKTIAEIEERYKTEGYTPFDRATFAKLTDDQTRLADEYYMEKYGMTVVEKQMEEPDINHLMTGTNIGRLLSKGS